jgi:nucleoid-associated protein YgaU
MGHRARRGFSVLVAGEALAVAGLHRLGSVEGFAIPRGDFARWLRETPSEDVLLAGIRLAALVAAWWLLATTVLYLAARLAHLHGAAHALGWATLPAVRRWADRAAAVTIVAASALGAARPAAADPPPSTTPGTPPVVVELDHRDRTALPDHLRPNVRTGRAQDAPPPPSSTTPAVLPPVLPPTPASPPPASPTTSSHVVARGEHLWSISADHVGASTGRPTAELTPADIAPYWRRAVELNRLHLRSGNPNLVYPGEIVELPPL